MIWNHRIIRRTDEKWDSDYYAIHEVFYDEDGVPYLVTKEPVPADGETLEEVQETLKMLAGALSKPVIDMEYFDDLRSKE